MAICTVKEIFDFMGTEEDVRIKKEDFVEFLIDLVTKELETKLYRKLKTTVFTDVILKDKVNCYINNNKIYFKNQYRDIYEIVRFIINDVDVIDFTLDKEGGILTVYDDIDLYNSKISIDGKLGLVDENEELFSDLKFAAMEIIAVKSRLWTRNIYTLEGTVSTMVLDLSDETNKTINRYMTRNF